MVVGGWGATVRGKLIGKNPVLGMFAVEVGGEGITVFELLDSVELELKDVITGPLDEHGSVRLRSKHLGEDFDAYVQAYGVSRQNLRKQLLVAGVAVDNAVAKLMAKMHLESLWPVVYRTIGRTQGPSSRM